MKKNKSKTLNDILINTVTDLKLYRDKVKNYKIDGEETDYYITDLGEVYSIKKYPIRKLTPKKQKHGYYLVHLHHNKKSIWRWLHRMVAECFLENDDPKNKTHVNHKDGDKSHNYLSNLEWVTPKENVEHAFKNNLRQSGENSSHALITEKQAHQICKLLEANELTMQKIADKIGCSYATVFQIHKKLTWIEVSSKYNIDNYDKFEINRGKSKLTEKDVHEICKLLTTTNITGRELAKKYNVHESTIGMIRRGLCWPDIGQKYGFIKKEPSSTTIETKK